MTLGIDFFPVTGDPTLRIDDEGVTAGKFHEAHHAGEYAVLLGDRLGRIGEHLERQTVFLRERFLRLDVVHADPEDHRIGAAESEDLIAELAGLRVPL